MNDIIYEKLIPYDVAHLILGGYMYYYHQFKRVTKRAKLRFEEKNWHGIQKDSRERINLYKNVVGHTKNRISKFLDNRETDKIFWLEVKRLYFEDVTNFNTRNISETFYNSVFRHFHAGLGADEDLMFVRRTGTYREFRSTIPIFHTFFLTTPIETTIEQIFHYFKFDAPYENLNRDIKYICKTIKEHFDESQLNSPNLRIEILKSIFYRNKAAYIVGRMRIDEQSVPFVIPLLHDEGGIYVDALLLEVNDVRSIFSYHRAYFLVDVDIVSDTVDFLQTILPHKSLSELYNSIGFEKHGKTVFYREYLRHMSQTEDEFVIAPGVRGMVMSVFTLPSLNMVFKVIKDKFDPPKTMTAALVKEKYKLVNLHDRVGRMTDPHMFEHFVFDKKRFSEELLEELKTVIGSKLKIDGECVIIDHLYVEKRMTPLNLYLEKACEKDACKVIDEYGKAIKQLAAANIFPGDMLLKNFGVTRLKRVVFYDYDEIGFLTDYKFRSIPEPRDDFDEMSSEPYFHVGPNDIFPEELRRFLLRPGELKSYFEEIHGDLFTPKYWIGIQNQLKEGVIVDVFPYELSKRFRDKYEITEIIS